MVLASLPAQIFIPSASAGYEALPDVQDSEGDVRYHQAWADRTHDYLDILAMWSEYDNSSDSIRLWMKTAANEQLENPPPNWRILCETTWSAAAEGMDTGVFTIRYTYNTRDGQETVVAFNRGNGAPEPINHAFNISHRSPGHAMFELDLGALLARADSLSSPNVVCTEDLTDPSNTVVSIDNSDTASAESLEVQLRSLRGTGSETGDEPGGPSSDDTNGTSSNAVETPGLPIAGVWIASTLFLVVRILRRPHG